MAAMMESTRQDRTMTDCNNCGGCCDPVMLPYSRIQAETAGPDMDPLNRRWVLEDLTPISRREGMARSPYVKDGLTILGDQRTGEAHWFWSFFYDCKHYDAENKRCTNYENRPPICRDYPWYDGGVDTQKALPLECSFRADQDALPKKPTVAETLAAQKVRFRGVRR